MPRSYKYAYKVRIEPETKSALQQMAADTDFVVTNPGAKQGDPSPANFLDALAMLYQQDPARLVAVLKSAGLSPSLVDKE